MVMAEVFPTQKIVVFGGVPPIRIVGDGASALVSYEVDYPNLKARFSSIDGFVEERENCSTRVLWDAEKRGIQVEVLNGWHGLMHEAPDV